MTQSLFDNLFIFEVANNHEGSVEHGAAIVDAMGDIARRHGLKGAVKFQYRDLDTFVHPDFKDREDVKHIPRFFQNRLSGEQFRTLVDRVKMQGLVAVVTPFDEASVQQCINHDVDILKVASCSANDWPLLEAVADAGKPVIISTGGLSIYEIDDIVSFFKHRGTDFALMHCLAIYPTPNEKLQMNFMERMIKRYPGVLVGYSGHEAPENTDVVKVAISKGARLLERHVGIPFPDKPLNAYSMNPEQVEAWVMAAKTAQEISGQSDHKHITNDETESLLSLKRGVYARRPIKQGETITRDDVFFAMPAAPGQLTSGDFGKYRAVYTASRDYNEREGIAEAVPSDNITHMRTIVHDVKGMLHEANVQLGSQSAIELSHHFGLEKFRQVGALLVTVVNREYCKKLVVMLPSQTHPNHLHKEKEETFHLLWGDLTVDLNGTIVEMKPGDVLLVERNTWHSFATKEGAIIEEVSTSAVRGDSYYEDETIRQMDPLERKTILEDW